MVKKLLLVFLVLLVSEVVADDQGDWVDVFELEPIIGRVVHPFYAGYLYPDGTPNEALYYVYYPS